MEEGAEGLVAVDEDAIEDQFHWIWKIICCVFIVFVLVTGGLGPGSCGFVLGEDCLVFVGMMDVDEGERGFDIIWAVMPWVDLMSWSDFRLTTPSTPLTSIT